jgi:hypothetical protein
MHLHIDVIHHGGPSRKTVRCIKLPSCMLHSNIFLPVPFRDDSNKEGLPEQVIPLCKCRKDVNYCFISFVKKNRTVWINSPPFYLYVLSPHL